MERSSVFRKHFLLALLSGGLQYVCYFPLNLGPVAFVALVPLLLTVYSTDKPKRGYLGVYLGTWLGLYLPVMQWIRVAHPAMYASWIGMSLFCTTYLTITLWLIRVLVRRGLPLTLAAPIAWAGIEYFRAHAPTGFPLFEQLHIYRAVGFPWYLLGHTQHDFSALAQLADITGIFGISFVIVGVNAAIASFLMRRLPTIERPRPWARLVPICLLIAAVAYGYFRLNHEPFAEGPKVAIFQTNIEQDLKIERGTEMTDQFNKLIDRYTFESRQGDPVDLVVWPETTGVTQRGGLTWIDLAPGIDIKSVDPKAAREMNFIKKDDLPQEAVRYRTNVLYGLNTIELEPNKMWTYNSALLVDAQGQATGRYDKIHLVPFGEYVPFEETLPFMHTFTPYEGKYGCKPGESYTRFAIAANGQQYRFGAMICYEDSDAIFARRYVRCQDDDVHFLVNLTNDGWFRGTAEHDQHLAISRFRAIEARRSLVRSVNMGISAVVDPDGKVIALPGETWAKSKKVDGIVRSSIPIDTRVSLYSRLGDTFAASCLLITFIGFALGFFRKDRLPIANPSAATVVAPPGMTKVL